MGKPPIMRRETWINPAFHRHKRTAVVIGRILAAFGEIELEHCRTCAKAVGREMPVLRTLYRIRMTSQRLDTAHTLGAPLFIEHDLGKAWDAAYGMVTHCLRIRNQYAHCNWGDHQPTPRAGLFFTNLGEAAADTPNLDYEWRHIDQRLATAQESFFVTTIESLRYLDREIATRQGRLKHHFWPRSLEQARPPLHNPPEEHVPPWLSAEDKAIYSARALAAREGGQAPTRAHLAMEDQRKRKRAAKAAQLQRSIDGEKKPKE